MKVVSPLECMTYLSIFFSSVGKDREMCCNSDNVVVRVKVQLVRCV